VSLLWCNKLRRNVVSQDRAERFEIFVTWYLRLNGYFTVPSFVIHAGDDLTRIKGDVIGNRTEVDTIALRLPYSREESGTRFPLDCQLIAGVDGRFDVIFAEAKSGTSDSPNKIWRNKDHPSVEYLLRFLGWHQEHDEIATAAKVLAEQYTYEESNLRMRYIVFAERVNAAWSKKGVKYITFDDCIKFIAEERGQCWANSGIGRRSMHDQWNPMLKRVFDIANNASLSSDCRQKDIRKILENG
jgi:hypothetical protein